METKKWLQYTEQLFWSVIDQILENAAIFLAIGLVLVFVGIVIYYRSMREKS